MPGTDSRTADMLDIYVYYPRSPSLQPPRQVGQVQQPYRYADQGIQERDHTPGRDAVDARARDVLRNPPGRRKADPAGDAETSEGDGGSDDRSASGDGRIDTYA